jgi:hypothetical protein
LAETSYNPKRVAEEDTKTGSVARKQTSIAADYYRISCQLFGSLSLSWTLARLSALLYAA